MSRRARVIPSAHTSQVKMLAVASGQSGIGSWQSVQRNLVDDYRQAYGTAPGPVLGIAVMTIPITPAPRQSAKYAGIRIGCGKG